MQSTDQPHKVDYSVVALNEHGGYVHEWIWGDWMDIRAQGKKTVDEA